MCWRRPRWTMGAPGATWGSTAWRSSRTASRRIPEGLLRPAGRDGGDSSSRLLILYNGASRRNSNQRVYARRSSDGGLSWSGRSEFRQHADAAFPAAIGGTPVTSGSAHRRPPRARTAVGTCGFRGARWRQDWSRSLRISDASRGTAYIRLHGFLRPTATTASSRSSRTTRPSPSGGGSQLTRVLGGTWYNRTRVAEALILFEPDSHSSRLEAGGRDTARAMSQENLEARAQRQQISYRRRPAASNPRIWSSLSWPLLGASLVDPDVCLKTSAFRAKQK